MKISGEIKVPAFEVKNIKIPEISIKYDNSFTIGELKGVIETAKEVPDAIAVIAQKMMGYEKEFSQDSSQEEVAATK
jgi:aminopeptidase-like protein